MKIFYFLWAQVLTLNPILEKDVENGVISEVEILSSLNHDLELNICSIPCSIFWCLFTVAKSKFWIYRFGMLSNEEQEIQVTCVSYNTDNTFVKAMNSICIIKWAGIKKLIIFFLKLILVSRGNKLTEFPCRSFCWQAILVSQLCSSSTQQSSVGGRSAKVPSEYATSLTQTSQTQTAVEYSRVQSNVTHSMDPNAVKTTQISTQGTDNKTSSDLRRRSSRNQKKSGNWTAHVKRIMNSSFSSASSSGLESSSQEEQELQVTLTKHVL